MKKLTYSLSLIVLCLCSSIYISAAELPGKKEYSKVIEKEFTVNADANVNIQNKYGKVDIKTWDKNEVTIKVTILVNERNEEQAEETFERIDIDINGSKSSVRAITTVESVRTSWWSWSSSSDKFEVNYDIYMPKSNSLTLKNKYGDSFIGVLNSGADIEIKYGDIKMDGVTEDLKLVMGYSSGSIEYCGDLSATLKYSDLKLGKAADMQLETKYSEFYLKEALNMIVDSKYDDYVIGKLESCTSKSKYDDYRIDEVHSIDASSAYSDYVINKLTGDAKFKMSYGDAKFDEVASSFTSITLQGSYTDYSISVEDGASYSFEGSGSYSDISVPSNADLSIDKEKGSSREVKGTVGGGSSKKIKMMLSYGEAIIR